MGYRKEAQEDRASRLSLGIWLEISVDVAKQIDAMGNGIWTIHTYLANGATTYAVHHTILAMYTQENV